MEDLGYSSDKHLQPSAKLSLFFKGVAMALQRLREKIPKQLADESRKICAGALQKVLMKVAFATQASTSPTSSSPCRRMLIWKRSRPLSHPLWTR